MMMMKKEKKMVMINYYHYWSMMMNISLFQPYLGSVKRDLPPFRLREASKELDTEDDEEKARDFLAGFGASELQ
jgi:hypothetical protein